MIIVFEHPHHAACAERQFVLQARDIASEISQSDSGYALWVRTADAEAAIVELDLYIEENRNYVPRPALKHPDYHTSFPGLIGYAAIIWFVAIAAEFSLLDANWYRAGRINTASILDGEWYRLATALTLHGDFGHIAANMTFGMAIGFFAGRYFGYGLASLAIFLSGIAGNAMNTLMKGPGHFAIGASTAVFGALGLIGVYAWRLRLYPQQSWPQRWGPIVGALALLAYTGTGDEDTDIGAHFWGFAAGAGAGWLLALTHEKFPRGERAQRYYAAGAVAVLAGCWAIALMADAK